MTISKPSGTAEGDVLVAAMNTNTSLAHSITPPSGWTQVGITASAATRFGVWQKIAGPSEPADYTWTTSGNINSASPGAILRYSPQSPSLPPGIIDASGFGSAQAPAVAPSVSAAATDDTLIALFSAGDQTVGSTPSGMTQRFLSDQSLTSLGIYDEALSASGATGSRTWTGSGSGTGASIVIRASAAAGRIRMMV